ncbi:conserved hypothetical protein [Nautilia profundicola AmH]|uniref:SiaC family regulatory phosphoprotein domain-containing protein n=1 Tax=Nautilia profundicola (strain ATCC BAA-1463 / DSM 18972 / AmH) TaxID=598659 RepID=B9L9U6_NAUPA|nr:DUF1987 domain-containing protein [Nautilia profundicola]ACM92083.1 conserved hypothetical protein [Nautilia profundicola AmH]
MENLYIPATKYTPEISLNAEKGIIEIRGKSYPENTFDFYEPVLKWIEEYFNCCAKDNTVVNFEIIYFNSSSSKVLFDLFDILQEAKEKNNITINWIYDEENESAEEAGEDFKEDFPELNINLIKKSEEE